MFITLLLVTFLIALSVSAIVAWLFAGPVRRIMDRIIDDEIADTWVRYLLFALVVVGLGGGVRVHQLERYVSPRGDDAILALTRDRWVIEVYSTVIGTLGAIAWMLLVFFVFTLIAYVIVRAFEARRGGESAAP